VKGDVSKEMAALDIERLELVASLLERGEERVGDVNAVFEVERVETSEHELVDRDWVSGRVVFESSVGEEKDVFGIEVFELQTIRNNKSNARVGDAIEATEVEMSDVGTLLDQRN
jgi:hypothetical protein